MARKVSLLSHTIGDSETQRSFRLLQESLNQLLAQADALQAQVDVLVAAAGEANTASNLGGGNGVYASKVGVDLRFKSLVAGTGMTLTAGANDITFAAIGEANTASNVGAGAQVFKAKTAVDLAFRSLVAGANITLTQNANDITIAAAAGGEANTASNLGAGAGLYASKSGVDLRFKSLVAGSNVTLTAGANDVTIASASTPWVGWPAGGDDALAFDGVATVADLVPAAGVNPYVGSTTYTMTRDLFATTLSVNAGVVLVTAGYKVHAHSISGSGKIANNGGNGGNGGVGVGGTAGAGAIGAGGSPGRFRNSANAGGTSGQCLPAPWGATSAALTGATGVANGAAGNNGVTATARFQGGSGGGGRSTTTAAGGNGSNSGSVTTEANRYLPPPWVFSDGAILSTGSNSATPGAGGGAGGIGLSGSAGGGGGGAGGGGVGVFCGSITGVTVEAKGGDGGNGGAAATNGGGGGGGGGGGIVCLAAATVDPSVTVSAAGGTGGTGGLSAGNGGDGAPGRAFVFKAW